MTFPIYEVIFYVFAITLVMAALGVIFSKNPVYSALFLVLCFFCSAVLWMMMQAEFLSLVLIFVYVGAVMTLFLFVIMMLNVDFASLRVKFVRYLPLAIIVAVLFVGLMVAMLEPANFSMAKTALGRFGPNYSNTQEMGTLLFTRYQFELEIAAVILLVAMISAISLAFHGRRAGTKAQRIAKQHAADRKDRLQIIPMKPEKK